MVSEEKIEIENVNTPGRKTNVNAVKYREMKSSLLKVLPTKSPGLTHKEILIAVRKILSENIFPGGETSEWWSKTVQLDLEAKNILVREATKPLRWYKK